MSVTKTVRIKESARFQIGAQAANLFNSVNYAPPNTVFNTAAFGTISNVQTAEGPVPVRSNHVQADVLIQLRSASISARGLEKCLAA
jgi:hypothetical protein